MRRFTFMLFVALLGAMERLAAQEHVEIRSITSEIKLDEIVYGHMTEINGKFKMRATEVTFAPGGFLGVHHHVGPEFDTRFPARLRSLKQDRARSTKPESISSKQETLHILRRTKQTFRSAYCSWRFFPKTGQPLRLFHRNHSKCLAVPMKR